MGFDEGNLKDYQTNKYAFQRNGNRAVSDRFGRADQALELNGSGQNQNQYIEMALADFNHLDITDLTITAWIKLRDKGFIIMDNRVEWAYKEQGYQFQINDSGQLVFMSHNDTRNACNTFPYDDTCSVDSQGAKVSQNIWTHVAITKQGTKPYFYINGNQHNANKNLGLADIVFNGEAVKRYIGTADDPQSWSGNFRTGTNQYSKGSIDDLRIYNRPLSQSEILQIKNYQPPHPCIKTQPESRACITCRGNRSKLGNECLCPDGSYEDNSSQNCPVCGPTCNKCIGTPNNCTECKDPNKINNGGSCVTCKDGYFYN